MIDKSLHTTFLVRRGRVPAPPAIDAVSSALHIEKRLLFKNHFTLSWNLFRSVLKSEYLNIGWIGSSVSRLISRSSTEKSNDYCILTDLVAI